MHGPNRYAIHNAIRNTMARICQDALLSPVIEPSPFNESEKRPDVLLRFRGPGGSIRLVVVDVAMTTVATRRAAALAEPGGAATRYEQTKRVKYQALADEMGAELVPLVVDDCGAWGESALPFWRRIAGRYAVRFDLSRSKAMVSVMGAVATALMSAVAKAIRTSAAPRSSFLP
jgi:hypothetical protein